jgi:hypothetical protein
MLTSSTASAATAMSLLNGTSNLAHRRAQSDQANIAGLSGSRHLEAELLEEQGPDRPLGQAAIRDLRCKLCGLRSRVTTLSPLISSEAY